MRNKQYHFLLKSMVLFLGLCVSPTVVHAIDDGAYAGFYKVTFAAPNTGERRGDTGELVFSVQSNKIVDIDYSDDGFVKGKTKYKLKIDENTGELKGYFTERNRRHGADVVSLRWQLKGVFVGSHFAGNATVYLTQYNGQTPESGMLKIGTYAFESP